MFFAKEEIHILFDAKEKKLVECFFKSRSSKTGTSFSLTNQMEGTQNLALQELSASVFNLTCSVNFVQRSAIHF